MCVGAPAGAFSEPKIAAPRVSRSQNTNFGEMGRAGRESNRVPPLVLPTKSKDQSTRLFSPQNIGSVKIFYVSKIESVCALPAGPFSESKIAALCSFGTEITFLCISTTYDTG